MRNQRMQFRVILSLTVSVVQLIFMFIVSKWREQNQRFFCHKLKWKIFYL